MSLQEEGHLDTDTQGDGEAMIEAENGDAVVSQGVPRSAED